MALIFPNPSRSFQKARDAIGFNGYDGMREVQFFVEIAALKMKGADSSDPDTREARRLAAFDALRVSIIDVAREAYANSRRTSYTLTAADFR